MEVRKTVSKDLEEKSLKNFRLIIGDRDELKKISLNCMQMHYRELERIVNIFRAENIFKNFFSLGSFEITF